MVKKSLQEQIYDVTDTVESLLDWLEPQQTQRGEPIVDHLTRRHSNRSITSLMDSVVRKNDQELYRKQHGIQARQNFSYYAVDNNYNRREAFTESTFASDYDLFFALKECITNEADNISDWLKSAEQDETLTFDIYIEADEYSDEGVNLKGSGIVRDRDSTLYPVTTDMKTLIIACDRSNDLGFRVVTFYPDCDLSPTSHIDKTIDMAAEMRKTYAFKTAQSKQEKHRLLGMCPNFQPQRERVNQSLLNHPPDEPTPGFNL